MMERLRKMTPETKRKVVGFVAGFLTLLIFAGWLAHSTGLFSSTFKSTRQKGVALFGFVDQNVEKAYDAFQKNVPKNITELAASTTEATTTETITTASTTQN